MAFKKLPVKLFAVLLLAVITSATDLSVKSDIFAQTVYKYISQNGKNNVFSPLSLHAVMALAYQGSAGHTERILKVHFLSKAKTATGYLTLLWDLNRSKNVSMQIANKIYVRKDHQFKKKFEYIAKNNFQAEVESVVFRQKQIVANKINNWVKQKTHNKIKNLLSPNDLNGNVRSVILNAIYFKGEWESKFDKSKTRIQKFYLDNRRTVNCLMMHQHGSYFMGESRDLDATLLRLKFRNPRFSLIIVLPKTKTGITRLEARLPTTDIAALTKGMWGKMAEVYLPRFKIESKYEFKKAFEKMGLEEIYSNQANFSNIMANENLKVSKIVQKATIEINEEGGEAAAATALVTVLLSANYTLPLPAIFRADHPFMYLLTFDLEQNTSPYALPKDSVVLFMGKVAKP
ncbi:Serpin (serine protease inhibitor) [Popillia japonica]|uniref:Serpin (Serine protease inhibitor) n=1 Tax=Popillia japonica TaxID=7064 RepID=A0AAW1LBG8_POPJA